MQHHKGCRMVKPETCRVAKILVKNPSVRLLDKKFRYSRKVTIKPCKNETLRLVKNIFEILPKFSETHVFQGNVRHPYQRIQIYYLLLFKRSAFSKLWSRCFPFASTRRNWQKEPQGLFSSSEKCRNTAGDSQESTRRSSNGSQALLKVRHWRTSYCATCCYILQRVWIYQKQQIGTWHIIVVQEFYEALISITKNSLVYTYNYSMCFTWRVRMVCWCMGFSFIILWKQGLTTRVLIFFVIFTNLFT